MRFFLPGSLLGFIYACCSFLFSSTIPTIEPIAQEGKGILEKQEGHYVLYISGTPYAMGYQHGVLLKELIQQNVQQFIHKNLQNSGERSKDFLKQLPSLCHQTPPDFLEEIRGMAEGAQVPFNDLLILNLFPEMFHCSAITAHSPVTADGKLYHVRVLDYAIGKGIQNSAVLIVAAPEGKIPFVNLSYAGFIGSVTGMNQKGIAIGEIGGQGYGDWNGVPMACLMRLILEKAESLEEAKAILENSARTCEYYYIISDGNQEKSLGVYATSQQIFWIEPGTHYAMFAPKISEGPLLSFFSDCLIFNEPYQSRVLDAHQGVIALGFRQPPHCLLMTGFSHPERYSHLAERMLSQMGHIDALALMQIIRRPVASESNLHNAIFLPSERTMWVSHAGPKGEPACDQPYIKFDLKDMKYINR